MKKTAFIVTGSRAEYGLLKPLIKRFFLDKEINFKLIVTGSHLSESFGNTYKEIENDGFEIFEKIQMLENKNNEFGVANSLSNTIKNFANFFESLERLPDIVVVLGDRFEIFGVSSVCYILNIPIAHIHGGETTQGSFDEAFRHSITKMSTLHFTSTAEYKKRVIQLGENPETVFNVGALGVENILNLNFLTKEELSKQLNINFQCKIFLVTFHSETLDVNKSINYFKNLLIVLKKHIEKETTIIFTKANADTGGILINQLIDEFVLTNKNTFCFTSLGVLKYLSLLKVSTLVIGNSSSGIIEAPTFKIPTINIGDRQKGRLNFESIINCEPSIEEIKKGIEKGLRLKINKEISVYLGDGSAKTSDNIHKIIKEKLNQGINLKKSFYDLG